MIVVIPLSCISRAETLASQIIGQNVVGHSVPLVKVSGLYDLAALARVFPLRCVHGSQCRPKAGGGGIIPGGGNDTGSARSLKVKKVLNFEV